MLSQKIPAPWNQIPAALRNAVSAKAFRNGDKNCGVHDSNQTGSNVQVWMPEILGEGLPGRQLSSSPSKVYFCLTSDGFSIGLYCLVTGTVLFKLKINF